MSNERVAFIHASPLAIGPLMAYYVEAEPEWTITNLLDDGILRAFRASAHADVESALASLVAHAVSFHGAEAAMITCSAARADVMRRVKERAPIPILKIDAPMAEAAVACVKKIGVLITFPPTMETTVSLLEEAALACGREVVVTPRVAADAHAALLSGNPAEHDRLLRETAAGLRESGVDAVVLAQISMAHMRAELESMLGIPVFSSLETSHAALRKLVEKPTVR